MKKNFKVFLIPKNLIINRYFNEEQEKINYLQAEKDELIRNQEEMIEEHVGKIKPHDKESEKL